MKRLFIILFAIVLSFSYSARAENIAVGDIGATKPENSEVTMSIITEKGYVSFYVGADWKIINAQGKPPIANLSFQINNPADAGTSDSTNLSVSLIYPNHEGSKKALDLIGKKYSTFEVKTNKYNNWQTYVQEGIQGKTTYTILDAKKSIADVVVHVRLAWPHLKNNSTDYEKNMPAAFNKILDSVEGKIGRFETHKEVGFRRQESQ